MTGYWLICLSLSNKLRIAVCDDSRTDVEMLEAAFDELPDYPVEYDVYFSRKELLMCSMQDKENYHLYIFDIEMPDMNGLELAKEVRKRDAKALFVFLTSYTRYVMEVFEVITFEKMESVLLKAMNYLNIHTLSDIYKTNMTTEEIWKQLDEKVFTHIHVSYIINLGHIRAIEGDEVVLDNAERLLIARYQKQGLKEKHMELMKRMV